MSSSIVTSILSSAVGLLLEKFRDSTAEKLEDGDVSNAEIREIVVRELNDTNSIINWRSRLTLLYSYDHLREGVNFLNASLDISNDKLKTIEAQNNPNESSKDGQSGILKQEIELPRVVEKLKVNSKNEFETAKKKFEIARERANTAFCNEALSIEDRIFAAKLRIVSEILEHLDSPETAITGCLSFLKKLHALPAIRKIFSVYLNRGIRSVLNKIQRAENVKSVMLINYVLFRHVWNFSNKCLFEVTACMPAIELPGRNFHPIVNWPEISARKYMREKMTQHPHGQSLDQEIIPNFSVVNSQGDVLAPPCTQLTDNHNNVIIIPKTKKVELAKFPKFDGGIRAPAIDINNNVYMVRRPSEEVRNSMLTILDENRIVKAEQKFDFLRSKRLPQIGIAICQSDDIIMIKGEDPHVYVYDKTCQLKYKFERDSNETNTLSISQQNEIMIPLDDLTAVQIYTKEGNLKTTIKVPENHVIISVAFHYVISKILVLTWLVEKYSYFILCYPEAGGKLETETFLGRKITNELPPKITSHSNGAVVVVRMKSITYL